ncbi:MAG: S8 family peptidase [Casimicrobiaceae bacterium]
MLHRFRRQLLLCVLLGALAPLASAQTVARIRVMAHPNISTGQSADATLAQLQAIAQVPLTLAAMTRTGALEFTLATPLAASDADALLARLRDDRAVLWAESVTARSERVQARDAAGDSNPPGRKVMLRLAGDPAPDWSTLLPRLSALAGQALTVERPIGPIWELSVTDPIADAQLAAIAAQLETDPAVRYADPVRRVTAKVVPNDPRYGQQWALFDPVGGVNAQTGWNISTGIASTVVAVIDTGITAHPELGGRVLPGYDFIGDPSVANDGTNRDPDPSDPGDWTDGSQCYPNSHPEASSWHGTFVSGIIAANSNNGAGIAGMNWNAKILPVRVLGRCGGDFSDIVAGVMWASGVPVLGAPTNTTPARVINLSLGGPTACPQSMQDAVNTALAQGTVVVVAAGNESFDASGTAPANCAGVINVGASTRQGDRASYSNFGGRIDISAPGGDGNVSDWIVSLSNTGTTVPLVPAYAVGIGTSFAAPHVAGAISLMLARNANLTPGQVLGILAATARKFPQGTVCSQSGSCGAGILDTLLALQNTTNASQTTPPGTVAVIEYYRPDLDHYLMTADPGAQALLDNSRIFRRTGQVFYAWNGPNKAPSGTPPLQAICSFFNGSTLVNSNIYTASDAECAYVANTYPGVWNLENPAIFYVLPADASGRCLGGFLPVYRYFNNRNDANMRHTVDLTVRREMANKQWGSSGAGPEGVAFCSPFAF